MRIWQRRAIAWMLSAIGAVARSRAINVGTAAYGGGCTSVTANSIALMPAPVRPCRMPPCARRLRRRAPMGVGRSRGTGSGHSRMPRCARRLRRRAPMGVGRSRGTGSGHSRMPPCARRLRRRAPMGVGRSRGLLTAARAQIGEEAVDVTPGVLAAVEAPPATADHAGEGVAGVDRDQEALEAVAGVARPANEQRLDV